MYKCINDFPIIEISLACDSYSKCLPMVTVPMVIYFLYLFWIYLEIFISCIPKRKCILHIINIPFLIFI